MEPLGILLWVLAIIVWSSPKSLGKWIAHVHQSYLSEIKEVRALRRARSLEGK